MDVVVVVNGSCSALVLLRVLWEMSCTTSAAAFSRGHIGTRSSQEGDKEEIRLVWYLPMMISLNLRKREPWRGLVKKYANMREVGQ
jgi:hypothetical protein